MLPEEVQLRASSRNPPLMILLATLLLVIPLVITFRRISGARKPPELRERIPWVSNTIECLTNTGAFIDRVNHELSVTKSNIIKFRIGLLPFYIVTGTKNVQTVLGSPDLLDGNFLQLMLMDKHWGMSRDEISKFANDKSGRAKVPAPGTENTPESERYWLGHDRLYVEYLSSRKYADAFAKSFYDFFSKALDSRILQNEKTITTQLFSLLKTTMAESAIISLFGSRIIDLNPGFVECYWRFDEVAGSLAWGLPKFVQRKSVAKKDLLHMMTRRHIDSAWNHLDQFGIDNKVDWEPHFGSRLSRETAKWLRKRGFSNHAAAGHTMATLFGLNGNTVPITAWAIIELIKDPSLFQAIREEALTAAVLNPTGQRQFDAQALVNLPLMQSLYVEVMRMHVSFNVTRKAVQTFAIDGYTIEIGSLVQTCSQIAHYEEDVWGTEDHPASEFWAWRHIKYVNEVDEHSGRVTRKAVFAMKGRPSSFFPYGGGYVMCPGRHFAKQEILLAIAIIISNYDIEFVEWVKPDGSQSVRPPQDDRRFAGFIAMHPDRDARIRLRQLF
ncbi:cytochrome P450 [Xylariaceae sp. AK1471]|nr:cytochrome P450 [Xylariaceae sp. AK1471]